MYSLDQSLVRVKGVGPQLIQLFRDKNLHTVKDLLLFVPFRYEDRSLKVTINQLQLNQLVTIEAKIIQTTNQYKGRRSMQRAVAVDETGRIKLIWFNTPFIIQTIQKHPDQKFFISGALNERGMMAQPKIELAGAVAIHTNRLVPVYSTITGIKPGSLRRLLKHVLDQLDPIPEPVNLDTRWLSLVETFRHIHFPDSAASTIAARERLALEELLGLMHHSQQIKEQWKRDLSSRQIDVIQPAIPPNLPFDLTTAQQRATQEVLTDLQSPTPMNRLLLGDVGSGKTVVAGIAAAQVLAQGYHTAMVAPTQILAEQHAVTLTRLFPDIKLSLLTAKTSRLPKLEQPTLIVGTHRVFNHLEEISPALVIYDEQHRFGVEQRSVTPNLPFHPHTLTMSATPIPRSLMLTIFSHLSLSVIDELPAGRQVTETWLVPESKRPDSYQWVKHQIDTHHAQVLIICPFIDPSDHLALENVAAATEMYESIKQIFSTYRVGLFHGQLTKQKQTEVSRALFSHEIDVLVSTPIIEVGVDLPAAAIMVIESAERFGLASLHQLRGRVGRAGQQGYCLLFSQAKSSSARQRLKTFCQVHDGMTLAEADLQHRGAGNLFGVEQHGFDQLRFAQWTNLELISQARQIFDQVQSQPNWQPLLTPPPTEIQPAAN